MQSIKGAPQTCYSCGSALLSDKGAIAPSKEFGGRELDYFIPGGHLWYCQNCHLHFRWPQLPESTLHDLYRGAESNNWSYEQGRRPDWKHTKEWLINTQGKGQILDIGCFDGRFLATLPQDNWDCFGVEIHEQAAQFAANQGVKIIAQKIEDLKDHRTQYDVVVAFDVIEHVPDPRQFLQTLTEQTKPKGWIVIGTGNTDAYSWRLMGSQYRYCIIPEHLAFIGDRWCKTVAEAIGLNLSRIAHFSHDPHWNTKRWFKQGLANLTYRFAPRMIRFLRQQGLGRLDASDNQFAAYPPLWSSAQDHLLAFFQKP